MNIATMSAQQFVNEMCRRSGLKIGSLYTRTPLKLKVGWAKSGRNPIIVVREGRNSMVGLNYEAAVNRQRVREQGETAEPFVVAPRQWGERLMRTDGSPTPFVTHVKDGVQKLYLTIAVRWEKNAKYETIDRDPETGNDIVREIDPSKFREYAPAGRFNSGRQGVEDAIESRDYTLGNICGWLHGGTYYSIVHSDILPTVPLN